MRAVGYVHFWLGWFVLSIALLADDVRLDLWWQIMAAASWFALTGLALVAIHPRSVSLTRAPRATRASGSRVPDRCAPLRGIYLGRSASNNQLWRCYTCGGLHEERTT